MHRDPASARALLDLPAERPRAHDLRPALTYPSHQVVVGRRHDHPRRGELRDVVVGRVRPPPRGEPHGDPIGAAAPFVPRREANPTSTRFDRSSNGAPSNTTVTSTPLASANRSSAR